MNLDEKLQAIRAATETLEPSAALQAKLAMTLETGTLPAAGASATGVQSALPATVKVLFVTLVLGVVGTAFYKLGATSFLPWAWVGSAQVSVDAGTARSGSSASAACPPASRAVEIPAMVKLPIGRFRQGDSSQERQALKALRQQLKSRPFACAAQQAPLEALLRMHIVSDAEQSRLLVRLGYLCPGAATPFVQDATGIATDVCDDADWCHYPSCSLEEEGCLRRWAQLPAESCGGQMARRFLVLRLCNRLLRADIDEAEVRAALPQAWCLTDAALDELAKLRKRTNQESP